MSGQADEGARLVHAPPAAIYAAFLNPEALAAWRPPKGIRAEIYAFDPRPGGAYRMAFVYEDASIRGKTADNTDIFEGRFLELVPDRRLVEAVTFTSDDPAFAGEMKVITTLTPSADGTRVHVRCEDVPSGISADDHAAGIASSLANLAAFVERR